MILIPVKTLDEAKQRLSPVLNGDERRQLAEAMLLDVFHAVASAVAPEMVSVVTGDAHVRRLAENFTFQIIADTENLGETHAIAMATAVVERAGQSNTLVLPADIPLVQPEEIQSILRAAPQPGAVIVPDRHGRGSNAVLRTPPALFPLRFGDDSFRPHVAAARATGKQLVVLQLAGPALDVDRPPDLIALSSSPDSSRSRAQELLRQWDLGRGHLERRLDCNA
jgi:2-phospho-L-lactate/phosphoenolpyruvate guanylyltransferase